MKGYGFQVMNRQVNKLPFNKTASHFWLRNYLYTIYVYKNRHIKLMQLLETQNLGFYPQNPHSGF